MIERQNPTALAPRFWLSLFVGFFLGLGALGIFIRIVPFGAIIAAPALIVGGVVALRNSKETTVRAVAAAAVTAGLVLLVVAITTVVVSTPGAPQQELRYEQGPSTP
jgi:hypothetical protein